MSWAGTDSPTPPTITTRDVRLTVSTDLFVAIEGIDALALTSRIPPVCRRGVDTARVTVDGETAVLESPTWTPRRGVRHLVPSFSLLGSAACSFRFEVSALTMGAWTPWMATATVGPAVFAAQPSSVESLVTEIDMYTAPRPLESVRLRVRLHPGRALASPWVMALSASDLVPMGPADQHASTLAEPALSQLAVPGLSQMEEAPAIRDRICSPTCVAMVLAFWGHRASVAELAAEVFHADLDRYGIWPAAIHAAARRGVAGYLLRFPDWASAAWCLRRGLPVIASIRFERGEIQGTPLPRTDGHLVVLTGEDDDDHVLVNDPAGASSRDAPRRYRRAELCRVWLERSGVGYVLFAP